MLRVPAHLGELSYGENREECPSGLRYDWVGLRGLEPRTSSLSGKRSNRLSYRPQCYALPDGTRHPKESTSLWRTSFA